MSDVVETVRKSFAAGDDERDKGLIIPADIMRYENILYGTDENNQVLDVYRLKKLEKRNLPVIISVHGGGWVYGDKERYQYYCMELAREGFAVVNYTYRLAPEFKFPAAIEDTNLVFNWLYKNVQKYKFDLNNIFGVGDSAGAHQLCIYTLIYTNPSYAQKFNLILPENLSIKALALNCGQYNIQIKDEKALTTQLMKAYLVNGGTEEELSIINILEYITPKFPPTYIMTATEDFLKEQSGMLAKILLEHRVPFLYRLWKGKDYQLGHVFHLNIRLSEANQCNREQCDFFKYYIVK